MEQRQDAKATERPAKSERSDPLPLADRRRLLRTAVSPTKPAQVITDWASI